MSCCNNLEKLGLPFSIRRVAKVKKRIIGLWTCPDVLKSPEYRCWQDCQAHSCHSFAQCLCQILYVSSAGRICRKYLHIRHPSSQSELSMYLSSQLMQEDTSRPIIIGFGVCRQPEWQSAQVCPLRLKILVLPVQKRLQKPHNGPPSWSGLLQSPID